jgi:hypothetical protein
LSEQAMTVERKNTQSGSSAADLSQKRWECELGKKSGNGGFRKWQRNEK